MSEIGLATHGDAFEMPEVNIKRYNVALLNDEIHNADYVASIVHQIFRRSPEDAVRLTTQVHETGRAVVWTGPLEVAEFYLESVQNCLPDRNKSGIPIKEPLGCVIEPA